MFKKLFKKKAGGTFFGNLIRSGVSKVSGGMLGTGDNRIELGQTKTNAQLAKESTGYASGRGTLDNPLEMDEVEVRGKRTSSVRDVGFQDHTIVGKLFESIRGELGAASNQVQPKVGIATETMLLGAAALLGFAFIMKK